MSGWAWSERISIIILILALVLWSPTLFDWWRSARMKARYDITKFFEVTRFDVGNSAPGQPVLIQFERVIKKPFRGRYTVEVRTFPRREIVCTASETITYRPETQLPDPITLAWWANNGTCRGADLPPDDYTIYTRWDMLDIPRDAEPQYIEVESNPFLVRALVSDVAQEAIEEQRRLKEQVEGLTRSLRKLELRD